MDALSPYFSIPLSPPFSGLTCEHIWWQSEVLVGSETVGRPVLIYPDITTDELIPQAKHKTPVVSRDALSIV